jgi:hypothetical protein
LCSQREAQTRIVKRPRDLSLPEGRRESKFEAFAKLSLKGRAWLDGPSGWRDPFLPEQEGAWVGFPMLEELFVYNGPGVMTGRTWVIAPDHRRPP